MWLLGVIQGVYVVVGGNSGRNCVVRVIQDVNVVVGVIQDVYVFVGVT